MIKLEAVHFTQPRLTPSALGSPQPRSIPSALGSPQPRLTMVFNFAVNAGEFVTIIGPSGSGKSTLLALIAGFETPQSGQIFLEGRSMAGIEPASRPISMIFQDHNAFAHMTVFDNIALGISPRLRLTASEHKKVEEALNRTGLDSLAQRRPGDLSGGERQRIAIARALVRARPILLMDEPFATLGPALHRTMLSLIKELQEENSLTILMASHQPEDARFAQGKVLFIELGKILKYCSVDDFFSEHDTAQIRDYLGPDYFKR